MRTLKLIWLSIVAFFTPKTVFNFEGRMKSNIDKLHRKASELNHFDENYENLEDFEDFSTEYFEHVDKLKKMGVPPQKAKENAHKTMTAKHGKRYTNAVAKSTKTANQLIGGNPQYASAAQFDITIKRITRNIQNALIVPLFAGIHFNARYYTLINQFLPPNITISGIATDTQGNVIITFTDSVAAVSDNVMISCNQVPYITFLTATNFDLMRITKFRYAIGDVTQQTQFDQRFSVATKSLFGKSGSQDLTVSSYLDPKQFQQKVIDVDNAIDIDKETGIFVGIIQGAADGFSITLNQFVQFYKKHNRFDLGK